MIGHYEYIDRYGRAMMPVGVRPRPPVWQSDYDECLALLNGVQGTASERRAKWEAASPSSRTPSVDVSDVSLVRHEVASDDGDAAEELSGSSDDEDADVDGATQTTQSQSDACMSQSNRGTGSDR